MRKYLIALYIRLSLEDSKTESMSIPMSPTAFLVTGCRFGKMIWSKWFLKA